MIKKIPLLASFFLMIFFNPVSASDEKPHEIIGDLSIADFHKETLSIPYVFVQNLSPQFDGLCFSVELEQNGGANNWSVQDAEHVECPASAAALIDVPEDSPSDSPDDSSSGDGQSEDEDSEGEDPIIDDSNEDDSSEEDTEEDNSREDDSEEEYPEEDFSDDLSY